MTKTRMARLIESELERAELVLNAKAITDKLQGVAEDLAKVKADDIMPMLDHLRDSFGPAAADNFSKVAGEKLDGLVAAIQDAKNAIGGEVSRLEQAVNGGEANDMASDGAAMAAPAPAAPAAPMGDAGMGLGAAEGEPGLDGADDLPDLSADMGIDALGAEQNAAGRTKKESANPALARNIRALRESANPDALILTVFRKMVSETSDAVRAMRGTARAFGIDPTDVLQVVRESKAAAVKKAAKRRVIEAVPQKPLTPADKRAQVASQQAQQQDTQRTQKTAQQAAQKAVGAAPAAKAPAPAPAGNPAPKAPQRAPQQGQPAQQAQPATQPVKPGQKPGVGTAPVPQGSAAPAFPGKTVNKVVAPESLMSKTHPLPKPAHSLMGAGAPKAPQPGQPVAEGRRAAPARKKV